MVLAISLIKTIPDREKAVYHALKEIDGIKNIYHIFGDHDLLVISEAKDRDELMKISNNIELINFVSAVKTMLVAQIDRPAANACSTKICSTKKAISLPG
jgi:uncharacterized protein with GYD domain